MTREEAQQAWEKMRSEIDETNWLFIGTINPQMVDMAIEALQADTVEVVRCKDCRHRVHDEERGLYYCEMYYGQGDVSDENFCQWGERSEE